MTRKYSRTADNLTISPADALKRHHAERSNMLVLANNQFFDIASSHILTPDLLATFLAVSAHARRENFTKNIFLQNNETEKKVPSIQCGECFPSINRLSALLGMAKAHVLDAVHLLENLKWLTITKRKVAGGRYTNSYKVNTAFYEKLERPFTVSQYMFFGGAWAFLKPSERLVWLLCRASAWYGGELTGHSDEVYDAPTGEVFGGSEIWFAPAVKIDIQLWSSIYQIAPKTITDAFKSLRQKNFLWSDEGYTHEGIVLRVVPNIPDNYPGWAEHLAEFYARLDAAKKPEISDSTKQLLASLA